MFCGVCNCVELVQEDVESEVAEVRAMLGSAGTGAATVVARKLLDTVVREARDWEVEQEALKKAAEGPAPETATGQNDSDCHEAAHLCKKLDRPRFGEE